jgi:hypothetical protein
LSFLVAAVFSATLALPRRNQADALVYATERGLAEHARS